MPAKKEIPACSNIPARTAYCKELEYLYGRRMAIDAPIESLQDYDRFRVVPSGLRPLPCCPYGKERATDGLSASEAREFGRSVPLRERHRDDSSGPRRRGRSAPAWEWYWRRRR